MPGICLTLIVVLIAATTSKSTLDLRLVPIADGLPAQYKAEELKEGTTRLQEIASPVGVDVTDPEHPLAISAYQDDRVFFLFYKTVENAFGDRPYLLQRIRKTVKEYAKKGDRRPETTVTYQVEVFKTIGGAIKGAGGDQHFGRYSLNGMFRREITKEYEIGFGEVLGQCTGHEWPYSPKILFKIIQPYGPDATAYDRVRFLKSKEWSLSVSLSSDGKYSVKSPEFGFDLPTKPPKPGMAESWIDPKSKTVVLREGDGVLDLKVGASSAEHIEKVLGTCLEAAPAGKTTRNLSFAKGLTFNVHNEGTINTIMTRPSFGGKTSQGIGHGATREEVAKAYGSNPKNQTDGRYWTFDAGVTFWFTGSGRVEKIVVTAPR